MAEERQTTQIDQEEYTRTLKILRDLFKKGQVYVALSPPFRVDFEIAEVILLASLKEARIEDKEKDGVNP